jgi:hypothetical protein
MPGVGNMGETVMMGRGETVRILGMLLSGMLAIGAPAAAATGDDAAATAPAPAAASMSLRDAIGLVAQHFDFTVVGANRLGSGPPVWPAEDRGAEAMLASLLKGYSYAVLLKPETTPGAAREPETLLIVGLYSPPAEAAKPASAGSARAGSSAGAVGSGEIAAAPPSSYPPSWAPPPSTVVRALTKLATTNSSNPAADQAAPPAPPMPNPANNAAAMASLTRSAQAGLGALVIGLRQACPTPNSC